MTNKMIVPLEVGICCNDLAKLRQFYENALDCNFISEIYVGAEKAIQASMSKHGYTVIRLQTTYGERIKLIKLDQPPQRDPSSEFLLDKTGISYLTFIVENIDTAIGLFEQHGAVFLTAPHKVEVRDGVYLAFCKDPEDNILELVQYIDIAAYRNDLVKGN